MHTTLTITTVVMTAGMTTMMIMIHKDIGKHCAMDASKKENPFTGGFLFFQDAGKPGNIFHAA